MEKVILQTYLDDVKVTVNSANVNYGVVGEYKSELIAVDESGNTSKKEIMVVVNEINQVNSSNNNNKTSSNTSSKPSKPSDGGNSGGSSGESTITKPTHCTTNSNHSMSCGNIGKWFSSKKEVERYWEQIDQKYFQQYENGQITWEEYIKKAPSGYECWSCSYCGKWTGNFKYR